MPSADPEATVERILDSGRNIRFGKGVVAKTSYVAAATAAVWGIIAWRWSGDFSQNGGLLIAGIVETMFAIWFIRGTQNFAKENPAQAMLEGAELIEWRRMDETVKGEIAPNHKIIDATAMPQLENRGIGESHE